MSQCISLTLPQLDFSVFLYIRICSGENPQCVWQILPFSLIIAQLAYSVAKLFYRRTWWEDFGTCCSYIKTPSARNTETCRKSSHSQWIRLSFEHDCLFHKHINMGHVTLVKLWRYMCRYISNTTEPNPYRLCTLTTNYGTMHKSVFLFQEYGWTSKEIKK